jgi:hypothetical protein
MPREMKVIKTEKRTINGRECEVIILGHEGERRRNRYIGCPVTFFREAAHASRGDWAALVVALLIYHRHCVCKSLTVKLPSNAELADLGIARSAVHRALRRLHVFELIRLHPTRPGCKPEITLLWPRSVTQE